MVIPKPSSMVEDPFINVRRFSKVHKVQRNIIDWDDKKRKAARTALEKAHRLQNKKRGEYAPNIAEVYREATLRRLTNIELTLTIGFTLSAILFIIGAFFLPILAIGTVFTAWFATIAFRLYRHHNKCHRYLLELNAQRCSHCGEPLSVTIS